MKLYYSNWHSINLLPSISVFSVCYGGKIGEEDLRREVEVILFGWVMSFIFKTSKPSPTGWSLCYGPVYSRRKKRWSWL